MCIYMYLLLCVYIYCVLSNTTVWYRCQYSRYTDEATENLRGKVICPKSHLWDIRAEIWTQLVWISVYNLFPVSHFLVV